MAVSPLLTTPPGVWLASTVLDRQLGEAWRTEECDECVRYTVSAFPPLRAPTGPQSTKRRALLARIYRAGAATPWMLLVAMPTATCRPGRLNTFQLH